MTITPDEETVEEAVETTESSEKEISETAELIFVSLLELASNELAIISLMSAPVVDEKSRVVKERFDFIFKDDNGQSLVAEGAGTPESEFVEALARTLQENKPDQYLAIAFFDEDEAIDDDGMFNGTVPPEEVLNWIVADGTIIPDEESFGNWSGTPIEPGIPFDGEGFEIFVEADDVIFLLISEFIAALAVNSEVGDHLLTLTAHPEKGERIHHQFFFKNHDDVVTVEEESLEALIEFIYDGVTSGLGTVGATLCSTLVTDDESSEETKPRQEVRCWEINSEEVRPATAKTALEVHDVEDDGTISETEDNVFYCDGWDIEESLSE